MIIAEAALEDLPALLALQKICYQQEAEIYQDFDIPPLTQTIESIIYDFNCYFFLKAVDDKKIIGSVRGSLEEGTCKIGRLIVHPDLQNRGVGSRLMNAIEKAFPEAKRFELFTGYKSQKNLFLYKKLGYIEYHREIMNSAVELVFLEKKR